ncbi:hypothetical protein VPH35_019837 [Triticum aestivum]
MAHYPPLARERFPGEVYTHGDPDLRPAHGGGIISRSAGMDALEADFRNRALLASVQGRRPAVSPEALVQALGRECGVEWRFVRVEVTHPADFFIYFASTEDCDRVFSQTGQIRCAGAQIAFQRWHRCAQASSGKLEFFCKLGIEGLPAGGWEWETLSQLVNNLQGQLVEVLPQDDRWQVDVTAWMRNPSGIPKVYDLEMPEPVGLPNVVDEDWPFAPPPPAPPTERRTLIHPLTIHVLDVVDRTVPFMALRPNYEPEDDEDLTRRHDYSSSCFRGRIDGEGRGNAIHSGGHPFGGPGGLDIAGDWGSRRVNGLLIPAGGLEPGSPVRASPSMGSSPVRLEAISIDPRSSGSPSAASTAVGSAAWVDTPCGRSLAASTAVGSAALGRTPDHGFGYGRCSPSPRRLSFSPAESEGDGRPEDNQASEHPLPLGLEAALAPLKMPDLQEVRSGEQEGAVSTPFAVPLMPHQLLPPLSASTGGAGVAGPLSAQDTLLAGLGASPRPSILGQRPAASAPVRRKKTLPPGFTPRRSERLHKMNGGTRMGPVERAQNVLLRGLGVIKAKERVSPEAMDAYLKLFQAPLASHHIKAVAALFDPDDQAFDEPAHDGFAVFNLPENVEPCEA